MRRQRRTRYRETPAGREVRGGPEDQDRAQPARWVHAPVRVDRLSRARLHPKSGARDRVHQARIAWAPSPLRRVLRHRFFRAGLIIALSLLATATWSGHVAALEQERAQWGELTSVLVVVDGVETGAPLGALIGLREIPLALVPAGAVREVAPDALAKTTLYPGEVLLAERVTGTDPLGPPAGTVALRLSTIATAPLLDRGDLIDVWAVDAANHSSRRIAQAVVVLLVTSDEVTIAVPEAHVAETTAAALRPVVITLVG